MKELISHMQKMVSLDLEEINYLEGELVSRDIKRKTCLVTEGQICQSLYFVEKGCLRAFFISEKGTEHTCQFAIENWWITDHMSLDNQRPSHFSIQAVENSKVITLTREKQAQLLNRIPKLERYFRLIVQRSFAASQLRIKYLFSQSGVERYQHFAESFPEFLQRVPQYMLASYLNISAEFLSKIRAGKV
ncbi:MAG: Crp/Fnr family transcriptional regulator [Bacteroidota bacterium]|nr:Crp/Fnr family transcriptional regulator [Bacteroidota bacterium]